MTRDLSAGCVQVVQGLGYPVDVSDRVDPLRQDHVGDPTGETPPGWMSPVVSRETKKRSEEL